MRGSWNGGDSPKRGRRGGSRSGAGPSGSPYDFSADDDDRVDPVDLLAIRADDELLDALASGRSVGPAFTHGFDTGMDSGYADDQQVLAMLASLRADVESEPFPELVSIDEASAAIVAGQRAARPRRRLMPVAAAAAVFVLALSGVAVAAGNAQPGDPLWGVSSVIDANRAKSVEAAYRVDMALTTAQQALAQGRVAEARQVLASVAPELNQVKDDERKDELVRKSQNLMQTADEAHEGEHVDTDESGAKTDPSRKHGDPKDKGKGEPSKENPSGSSDPSSTPSSGEQGPGNEDQSKHNPGQEKQSGPESGRPSPDSQQQQQQQQQGGQPGQRPQQGQQPGQQGPGQQGPGQQGPGQQNPDNGSKPPPSDKPAPDNKPPADNGGKPPSDGGNKPPSDGGSKPPPDKPSPDNGNKPDKPSGGDGKPSGGTNASNPSGGGKPTSDKGGDSGGNKGSGGSGGHGDGNKGDGGKSSGGGDKGDKGGGDKGSGGHGDGGGDHGGGKSKSDSEGKPDVANAKPSFTPPGGALPGTGHNSTDGDGPTT